MICRRDTDHVFIRWRVDRGHVQELRCLALPPCRPQTAISLDRHSEDCQGGIFTGCHAVRDCRQRRQGAVVRHDAPEEDAVARGDERVEVSAHGAARVSCRCTRPGDDWTGGPGRRDVISGVGRGEHHSQLVVLPHEWARPAVRHARSYVQRAVRPAQTNTPRNTAACSAHALRRSLVAHAGDSTEHDRTIAYPSMSCSAPQSRLLARVFRRSGDCFTAAPWLPPARRLIAREIAASPSRMRPPR